MTGQNCNWEAPPPHLALAREWVYVWRTSLGASGTRIQRLWPLLSLEERTRAERFHFEVDRNRFVVARGILRLLLGRYLHRTPETICFANGKFGKPLLAGPDANHVLRFNLSHSQDLALYAISSRREIGVDVEFMRPISDLEALARRFFSPQEYSVIRAFPEGEKTSAFFKCWTRKEAYIKALGEGLTRPLDQFEVSLAPGEKPRLVKVVGDLEEPSRWLFHELSPAPGYAATVVAEGRDWRLQCFDWSTTPDAD